MGDPISRGDASRSRVGSVARALQIVELVAEAPGAGLSLSEIARAIGVSKSTAHALAKTLVAGGHLRQTEPGPRYLPGLALLRLGDQARRSYRLGATCQPILDDLARGHGLLALAAINDRGRPIPVASSQPVGGWARPFGLGVIGWSHCHGLGKAILATYPPAVATTLLERDGLPRFTNRTAGTVDQVLADLDRVRRRGFAVEEEETVQGVFCFAAAVFDSTATCVGAIGLIGIRVNPTTRMVAELGGAVRHAAARLSARSL